MGKSLSMGASPTGKSSGKILVEVSRGLEPIAKKLIQVGERPLFNKHDAGVREQWVKLLKDICTTSAARYEFNKQTLSYQYKSAHAQS